MDNFTLRGMELAMKPCLECGEPVGKGRIDIRKIDHEIHQHLPIETKDKKSVTEGL